MKATTAKEAKLLIDRGKQSESEGFRIKTIKNESERVMQGITNRCKDGYGYINIENLYPETIQMFKELGYEITEVRFTNGIGYKINWDI